MLDWLKTILGDAYTEDVDAKVSAEIGKNFVSKADFNQVNEAKKAAERTVTERDQQLENLKKSTGNVEDLKNQISTLQTQNAEAKKNYEKQLYDIRFGAAEDAAIISAGGKNTVAIKALIKDRSKVKLKDDGTLDGYDLEPIKAEAPYLFTQVTEGLEGGSPQAGGSNGGQKTPEQMSYSEYKAWRDKQ